MPDVELRVLHPHGMIQIEVTVRELGPKFRQRRDRSQNRSQATAMTTFTQEAYTRPTNCASGDNATTATPVSSTLHT
jgi:hypothetical protein